MLFKKMLFVPTVLLIVVLLMTACKPGSPTETPAVDQPAVSEEPVHGGKLVMAIADLTHLDPVSIAGDTELYPLVYETLFEFDENWHPQPLLVKSVEISEDGKIHTWKLQEGIKFTDGSPFNAEVVKWNIDRKIEQQSAYADSIPWADDPVKVLDVFTVEVTLKEASFPMYNFLSGSSYAMYSKDWVESVTPDDLKNKMVGTGPFIVTDYLPNERVNLKRNTDYWQEGLPYLDEIEMRIVTDPNTRLMMLESGEVHWVNNLSIQDIERLEANDTVAVSTAPSTRTYFITMHNLRPPFDNVNVRKAFSLAVDKELMNETIFEGRYQISTGVATTYVQGYSRMEPYPYDPEESKRLLENAGLVDTNGDGYRELDGKEHAFLLVTRKGQRPGDIEIAEQFQAFMKEVGINIQVEVWDTAQYFTKLNQPFGEAPFYELSNQAPSAFTGDMQYPLTTVYSCWSFPGNFYNYSHYCNEDVDTLIRQGDVAGTLEERNTIYAQAQEMIWNDIPTIWLFDGILSLGYSPNLMGVYSDGAHQIWQVKYAWLAK
jgi:ABC-type transport system substrate-binding protein